MVVVWTVLLFVGALLGTGNVVALFTVIGAWLQTAPLNEKLGLLLKSFETWQDFWFALLIVPTTLGTAVTLIVFKQRLLNARSTKDHIFWGIRFGAGATFVSTFFLLIEGTVFNHTHNIKLGSVWYEIFMLPISSFALGSFLLIAFSPALAVSGCLYGLLAMKLKDRFSSSL